MTRVATLAFCLKKKLARLSHSRVHLIRYIHINTYVFHRPRSVAMRKKQAFHLTFSDTVGFTFNTYKLKRESTANSRRDKS